jgi:hypothetical protein
MKRLLAAVLLCAASAQSQTPRFSPNDACVDRPSWFAPLPDAGWCCVDELNFDIDHPYARFTPCYFHHWQWNAGGGWQDYGISVAGAI